MIAGIVEFDHLGSAALVVEKRSLTTRDALACYGERRLPSDGIRPSSAQHSIIHHLSMLWPRGSAFPPRYGRLMSAGLQPLVRRKNNPPFAFSHAHRTTIPTSTNRSIEMFAHGAFVPSFQYTSLTNREAFMSLKTMGTIEIPAAAGREFDHGAFDAKTRRVFVAHTARNCMEVIDHDTQQHIATLPGFAEAAGVVADNGMVLVTNRGAASLSMANS
jgi:hypothetical protein